MASPVNTTVKHFYSAMPGAPVLNGQAGSIVALLDACLVTGWGLKSATSLTVAGGVATLAFSGTHAAVVDAVILVEGVTGALTALNGEQKITTVGSGAISFATAAADGTAAGTITFKMAPAGWAKVFSGTNKAVYQSLDAQSTKMFLRIDDAGTTSCRLRGYESMSDVDTGVGAFPLDGQINGGGWMAKSVSANANAVKWTIVANARSFIVNVTAYSAISAQYSSGRTCFFGDFKPFRPGGDAYAFVVGCGTSNYDADTVGMCDGSDGSGNYAPRPYSGLGSSVSVPPRSELQSTGYSGADGTDGAFPSPIDGSLILTRRIMREGVFKRGVLPGLYTSPQSSVGTSIAPLALIGGSGALAGRRLIAMGCGGGSNSYPSSALGISFVDIVGPWDM